MITKMQRIRERNLLSVEFVAEQLGLDSEGYRKIEIENFESLEYDTQKRIANLFGVEVKDLLDDASMMDKEEVPLGFARSYSKISEKDKREIRKLIILKNLYKKEKCK